ncbi:hypothetical protein M0812_30273 [Anaeramoeba flamelloides]|uniref:Uncharacterized protein n=1 Tax=Anaeramoeba flamelloides TaxID=1746091 RepID=A0AAV7Y4Z5_9EUKA|nr:hypothetical protein M0812_30273 [Anaeramoeba flamelloides]
MSAFSKEDTDELIRKINTKEIYDFTIEYFLTNIKNKKKNTKKIKRKEIKIDENTKFVLFPLELIQIANNKKISTNNIDVNHSCQIEIINKEKNQKVVYNPTNTMFNNCVSKLNLKMVLLIFIAGFGFSDYLRIFSNLFESKSLMCTNTFYALQRSYIIPTIKKNLERASKKEYNKESNSHSKCMLMVDGLGLREKKEQQNICRKYLLMQKPNHFLTTRQTSIVETFNSTLNLWCPKYKHFKKDVYEARTYMTALHWNYQLISCQNSKQFMINKQLSKQIQSQVLNSFEQYHPYFNKNKKDPLMIDRQDHNENWNENGDKKENF